MISGEFSSRGELIFEIALIGTDGEPIPVKALLDTGFTGWLAIDNQDAKSLGWSVDISFSEAGIEESNEDQPGVRSR